MGKFKRSEVADEDQCFAKCTELVDAQGTLFCTGIKWRRDSKKPCRVFRGAYSGACGNQHPNMPQNRDTCWDVEDPGVGPSPLPPFMLPGDCEGLCVPGAPLECDPQGKTCEDNCM